MLRGGYFAVALSIAACVLDVAPANAAFYTGNELHEKCAETTPWFCMGFIAGVIDHSTGSLTRVICLPTGVTIGQVMDVVVNYLDDHPERRHRAAEEIVVDAGYQAFPCGAS